MWLITEHGFFSIVQKPEDRGSDTLTVRGRVKADLEWLAGRIDDQGGSRPEVIETPKSDYGYRFQVDKSILAKTISRITKDIDYDNFKATQDKRRENIYHKVWLDLMNLEQVDASIQAYLLNLL